MPSNGADPRPPTPLEPSSLPESSSPTLQLVLATPDEVESCALINSDSWSGPLDDEAYLRRERYLRTHPTAGNGEKGASDWILIDGASDRVPRNILSSCESWRKEAIVARPDGTVENVVAHGIGSVYCRKEYRGKGYAVRMLQELKKKLEYWQQEEGNRASFNVLYSDIGKVFYAKHGWLPYLSSHITLEAVKDPNPSLPKVKPLVSSDLIELCKADEMMLRQGFAKSASQDSQIKIAFVPNPEIMAWHHAREEFVAKEVLGLVPEVKGAIISRQDGMRTWCIWTRSYARNPTENTLFILRMVVEGGAAPETKSSRRCSNEEIVDKETALEVAACLSAAQQEAHKWDLRSVEIWNPSLSVLAGAQRISSAVKTIHRDTESIPCLLWYGSDSTEGHVEWIANEKYGWC